MNIECQRLRCICFVNNNLKCLFDLLSTCLIEYLTRNDFDLSNSSRPQKLGLSLPGFCLSLNVRNKKDGVSCRQFFAYPMHDTKF